MAVTNYYTVNGEIIGEKTGASARVDYLTDALGNVTATVNQSAQVVNTYRYKPYGALLAKTGAGADPSFQWVGAQGYRQTGQKYSDVYVRARHYDTNTARWTTKDLVYFQALANLYMYVAGLPTRMVDRSGWKACSDRMLSCCSDDCCSEENKKKYYDGIKSHCKGGWESCNEMSTAQCNPDVSQCDAVQKRLVAIGKACNDMCKGSGEYGRKDPWAAATMCCYNAHDKQAKFCDIRCCPSNYPVPPSDPASGCILSCLWQHEQRHKTVDCTKDAPTEPPENTWDFPFDECCTFLQEVHCLYDKFATICGWPQPPARLSIIGNCYKWRKKCPDLKYGA